MATRSRRSNIQNSKLRQKQTTLRIKRGVHRVIAFTSFAVFIFTLWLSAFHYGLIVNAFSPSKPELRGVMDRDKAPDASYRTYNGSPLVNSYVIKTRWNVLQPNSSAELRTDVPNPENNNKTLDQSLAEAASLGMQVRLRIYAGIYTPSWVNAQVGSIAWYDSDEPSATYTIPKFWTTTHRDLWNNFMTKLSDRLDSNPRISQVTISRCSTVFAEPLIRQISDSRNLDTAINAGYTKAADLQCQKDSIDILQTTWPKTRASFAFNPFQAYDETKHKVINPVERLSLTKQLIDYCRSQLGSRCVLGNNSLRDNATSSEPLNADYDDMYNYIKSKGPPIYFQTATPAKIGDWSATLQKAISLGASSVELPSGSGGYFSASYDKAVLSARDSSLEATKYPEDVTPPSTSGHTNSGGSSAGPDSTINAAASGQNNPSSTNSTTSSASSTPASGSSEKSSDIIQTKSESPIQSFNSEIKAAPMWRKVLALVGLSTFIASIVASTGYGLVHLIGKTKYRHYLYEVERFLHIPKLT